MNKKVHPLYNDEIERALRHIKGFIGVFSRDEAKKLKNGQCLVLNLDGVLGSGTHWVGYYRKNDSIYYFDSFGLPPPQDVIDQYRDCCRMFYSSNEIQKMKSIKCGYYVIMFLDEVHNGKSMYDFIYQFDPEPSNKNENMVLKYFGLL